MINTKDFTSALETLTRVTPAKPLMPCLANVLIDGAQLYATSLDQDVRITLSESTELPAVAVPAKLLLDRVRAMGAEQIRLKLNGDTLELSANRRRFQLETQPADQMPRVEHGEPESWHAAPPGLKAALTKAITAANQDETRPHLCAVLVNSTEVAATDGHRVHVVSLDAELPRMLIPRAAASTLTRILTDESELGLVGERLLVRSSAAQWSCRLADGAGFPPYQQVIPTQTDSQLRADTRQLLDAVLAVASSDDRGGVRLKIQRDQVVVCSAAGEDVVPCEATGTVELGMSAAYLADAVKAVAGETLELGFSSGLDPVVIKGNGTAVVMPMRV